MTSATLALARGLTWSCSTRLRTPISLTGLAFRWSPRSGGPVILPFRHRVACMGETLPLFPLGTVLFPGLVLPLHIFEDRYKQLVRDLLDGPEPRRFGVIAIRHGRETGVDGIQALHEIGCTATLRQIKPLEDGRYDVVTVGTQRFRLAGLDGSKPYLQGQVDLLTEETGDEADAARVVRVVRDGFRAYLSALGER